jgi:hypothetical protein
MNPGFKVEEVIIPEKICGVYFLFVENALTYIGQSVDIYSRIISHRDRVRFDSAVLIRVPESDLNLQEIAFIRHFNPPTNRDYCKHAGVLFTKEQVVSVLKSGAITAATDGMFGFAQFKRVMRSINPNIPESKLLSDYRRCHKGGLLKR